MGSEPAGGAGFDRLVVLVCSWLGAGFWLDEWAHYRSSRLETVFTPWHGLLYSGFLAVAAVLLGGALRARAHGCPPGRAVLPPYRPSVLGVVIFGAGAVADLTGHLLFSIETDLAALLSPPHLIMALGGGLIVSGPARAAWCRSDAGAPPSWSTRWPAMLSLVMVLSVLTSYTAYANPLARPWAAAGRQTDPADIGQALGLSGVVVYTGLLMGVTSLCMWRGILPFGGLMFLFTGNAVMLAGPHGEWRFVPSAFLAGVIADLLRHRWRPSAVRAGAWRTFAFTVPAVYFTGYFLTLAATGGIGWPIHLWAGAVGLSSVGGWLVSYLIVLPSVGSR